MSLQVIGYRKRRGKMAIIGVDGRYFAAPIAPVLVQHPERVGLLDLREDTLLRNVKITQLRTEASPEDNDLALLLATGCLSDNLAKFKK